MKKEYYMIIQPFIPAILVSGAIIATLLLLKPPFYMVLLGLCSFTFIYSLRKGLKESIKNTLTAALFILFIHYLWVWLGVYGVFGLLLFCFLLVGFILYRRWGLYIKTLRDIEKLIWGRTNDRKNKNK